MPQFLGGLTGSQPQCCLHFLFESSHHPPRLGPGTCEIVLGDLRGHPGFQIALELGFGARRPDRHRDGLALEAYAVGRGQIAPALGQIDELHRLTAQLGRVSARRRAIAAVISVRSSTRIDSW